MKPWLSSTSTIGRAQQIAASVCRLTRADSENASSGTASTSSWKSKTIICCRPQEKPYAKPMSRPVAFPDSANPALTTGNTEIAVASAWKNSRVAGEGTRRKNGASTATATWKWLPNRLNPGPSTSTTGACSCDSCLTYSV